MIEAESISIFSKLLLLMATPTVYLAQIPMNTMAPLNVNIYISSKYDYFNGPSTPTYEILGRCFSNYIVLINSMPPMFFNFSI